jgi:hypothetical protein
VHCLRLSEWCVAGSDTVRHEGAVGTAASRSGRRDNLGAHGRDFSGRAVGAAATISIGAVAWCSALSAWPSRASWSAGEFGRVVRSSGLGLAYPFSIIHLFSKYSNTFQLII